MKTCTIEGCDGKHQARGMCARHWSKWYRKMNPDRSRSRESETVSRTCTVCGETWRTRRKDAKFCSDECKGLHYIELGPRLCRLPVDHPVRAMMRTDQRSELRKAFESGEWAIVLSELEAKAVKVDDCWLWPAKVSKGYATVRIASRSYGVHRLAASATAGRLIESHKPVHHICAETLCYNPAHLQVVEPHENAAEMLERRYYRTRIAELEQALREVAPTHPLICRLAVA